ncbi:hypothetical protein ACI2LD_14870 [Enterococcus casseliflavus]|uniref:hypothetical protein n=2 Tax=Enterococcus TaxID=1350 RepID=UPI002DBF7889|nr:hypothetical protein [Enterococcus casseliflavus]MEB6182222.1 hypothetical protein [Enterococcus casseliflavus]
MRRNYRRYNQLVREKNNKKSGKGLRKLFFEIVPISLSILGSIFISYKSNDVQLKISENNRIIQEEQNLLKREEFELNKANTHPAFTFDLNESENTILYTLNQKKGEMNNVNFSVFEIIYVYGTYNNKSLYIQKELQYEQSQEQYEFEALFPKRFDTLETTRKINEMIDQSGVDATITGMMINRFYNVSYMNFEHEYRDDYFEIGKNGIGKITENPRSGYPYNSNGQYKLVGGYFGRNNTIVDDDWLAERIFSSISNPTFLIEPSL